MKAKSGRPGSASPVAVQENIKTVAALERQFSDRLSPGDRFSDAIARFSGSLVFVVFHLVCFAAWVVVNMGRIGAIKPFDPFPFVLLGLIVSCEAVLLSTFVLMKQNRESRRSDARDHLNLQVDLLAEREVTKLLQMQIAICHHLGINPGMSPREIQELSEDTAIENLAAELHENIMENPQQPGT